MESPNQTFLVYNSNPKKEILIDENGCSVFVIRKYLKKTKYLFRYLRDTYVWEEHKVRTPVGYKPQPRKIWYCGDEGLVHKYSGLSLKLKEWDIYVKELKDKIVEEFNTGQLSGALLNMYEKGSDSISYHGDKEALGHNNLVVTVSLGETRKFYFRRSDDKKVAVKTELKKGDLIIMSGDTQKKYQHSIPKTKKDVGCRISITYRLINPKQL